MGLFNKSNYGYYSYYGNSGRKRKRGDINKLNDNGKFAIVEGYKIGRTALMFAMSAQNNKFVSFSSWNKGVGKTTAICNMAISLSKMGRKVLLIDFDMRKPNVHNLLKLKNITGASEVLGGFMSFDEAVQRDVLPHFDVLTSGPIPPNPSELIGSTKKDELFDRLEMIYDYILIDTPPIGIVTDALMLKERIAGYVMILREKRSTHGDLEKLVQMMKLSDAKILGFLKVGCLPKNENKYSKRYNYGYYRY